MTCKVIQSTLDLIGEVFKDYSNWNTDWKPWFRGEPRYIPQPLTPKVFRTTERGKGYKEKDEKELLKDFRRRASAIGAEYVPNRDYTDQWIFLGQHVGLPTRLLDWTEGLLIALHFAIYGRDEDCVVWMLNQEALNKKNLNNINVTDEFVQLTWYDPRNITLRVKHLDKIRQAINTDKATPEPYNISHMNIHAAWTGGTSYETPWPYCIPCTEIHPRMATQASVFTIHGEKKMSMCEMGLGEEILRKYIIAKEAIPELNNELRILGITRSTLFPDLDGLADDLSDFWLKSI